jgi:hypothetical protein
MPGRIRAIVPQVIIILVAADCASRGYWRGVPLDGGEVKFYAAPPHVVAHAARSAVLAAGLDIDESTRPVSATWMIAAKKGVSFPFRTYGDLVRVVVQRTADGPVAVRVITKRILVSRKPSLATDIIRGLGDWSGRIYEELDRVLATADRTER